MDSQFSDEDKFKGPIFDTTVRKLRPQGQRWTDDGCLYDLETGEVAPHPGVDLTPTQQLRSGCNRWDFGGLKGELVPPEFIGPLREGQHKPWTVQPTQWDTLVLRALEPMQRRWAARPRWRWPAV